MRAKTVSRETILNRIDGCLNNGWDRYPYDINWIRRYEWYLARAEALIELLEIEDCGSVGGFGKKRNKNGELSLQRDDQPQDLKSRYLWLKNMPTKG
jgi:hypothetical protein